MAEEAPKGNHPPATTSDLMGDAKFLGEAAQLTYKKQTDKIDKAKIAGAAEDVLESAKSYGNVDDKSSTGQCFGKAEDYLHQYHTPSGDAEKKEAADKKEAAAAAAAAEKKEIAADAADKEDKEKSAGGVGGLMNMAKGLF